MKISFFFLLLFKIQSKIVLVVTLEGVPNSLLPKMTQSISRMKEIGSYSIKARSTYYNNPASGFLSLLCSQDSGHLQIVSTKTKLDWFETKSFDEKQFSCIYKAIKDLTGFKTKFLNSNPYFEYFSIGNKNLDGYSYCPTSNFILEIMDCDKQVFTQALLEIEKPEDSFIFVDFFGLTKIGEKSGYGSTMYNQYLVLLDSYVNDLIELTLKKSESIVLLTSLNGAESNSFNTCQFTESSTIIPWLIAGKGIKRNYQTYFNVDLRDSIPTIIEALNIKQENTRGRIVYDIFLEEKFNLKNAYYSEEDIKISTKERNNLKMGNSN